MKRLLLVFTLAFAAPALAFAQQGPNNFQQIEALHKQYRAQVLGALTPAHKQLYASVVGDLAIAVNPDPRAAAAKLDAALSTNEKTAIINADTQFRAAMKTQWEQMGNSPRPQRSHKPRTPDAGRILLAMANARGRMMMPFRR